jgi:hypothetical protein
MNNAAELHYLVHLNHLQNLATQPLGSRFEMVLTGSVNYLHGFLVAMKITNQISAEEYQLYMTHLNSTERKITDEKNKQGKKS